MTTTPEEVYRLIEALVQKFKRLSAADRKQFNESATRLGYILPLFQALGWDTSDKNIVSPEEKVSRGFVDLPSGRRASPVFSLRPRRYRKT